MTGKVAQGSFTSGGHFPARLLPCLEAQDLRLLAESGIAAGEFMDRLMQYYLARRAGEKADDAPLRELVERLSRDSDNLWEHVKRLTDAFFRALDEDAGAKSGTLATGEDVPEACIRGEIKLMLCEACLRAERAKREELVKDLQEVDRFPDTIAATLDPLTLSRVGLRRLKEMLDADTAVLYEVDGDRRLVAVAEERAAHAEGPLPVSREVAEALLEKGEAVILEESSRVGDAVVDPRENGRCLLLPLQVRGRTSGVVLVARASAAPAFGREKLRVAEGFANRLAVALENARLHEREQKKIKETVALLEMTRAINSTLDLEDILYKAVRMSVDLCPAVMCCIYLLEDGKCVPGAWYGFIEEDLWKKERERGFGLEQLPREHLSSLLTGEPVVISSQDAGFLLPREVFREHGVEGVLLYPLKARERLSGLFAVLLPPRKSRGLEKEEMELVAAIASQAGMAIENASLYEDIERSYFSTVQALAKAIEVKDPYTRGHSERVTAYALMIAEAMRLDEREKQKLKYAATLHDIGKIGIAGRVLNKPGALTEEEYSHVKTHPALGDSIVEPVEFLQGPRPIILHHHERYDGRGYPDGLQGEDIPVCARILSVADAFEAMRSDRPYRKALPLEEARQELVRNAGTQFDPRVVEVFLDILDRHGGDPVKR
ncbi:MAG: GAF domain-containing protein [Actinobacteria bacterium]|nr:GAF domain-containing protein [Actinomycetota bacterium]